MRHNPSLLFWRKFYILSTKGSSQSTDLLKYHLSSWKSEISHFDGLLFSRSYKVSIKKVEKSYLSWHWRLMQSLKKNYPHIKYDMRNLVNIHQTNQKSENVTSIGSFCPKYIRFELKKYRAVIFYDTDQWFKIWMNLDLVALKIAWEIGWTFIRAHKSQKNCTLMSSFFLKHMMFQLENFKGTRCHGTEGLWKV